MTFLYQKCGDSHFELFILCLCVHKILKVLNNFKIKNTFTITNSYGLFFLRLITKLIEKVTFLGQKCSDSHFELFILCLCVHKILKVLNNFKIKNTFTITNSYGLFFLRLMTELIKKVTFLGQKCGDSHFELFILCLCVHKILKVLNNFKIKNTFTITNSYGLFFLRLIIELIEKVTFLGQKSGDSHFELFILCLCVHKILKVLNNFKIKNTFTITNSYGLFFLRLITELIEKVTFLGQKCGDSHFELFILCLCVHKF